MSRYRCVIFDCDSTLTAIEGIDVLAASHREEVARLTMAAMNGTLAFEEVYGLRLALVRPTRAQVEALGERYVAAAVPDAADTIAALGAEGIETRILSGGLLPAVLVLARALGVPDTHVAAVSIEFDDAGDYAGFDHASPLARAGGKREVIDAWRPVVPRPVMLVGDGATDLEARPAVDAFIAFAGVKERSSVVDRADVVIRAPSLSPVLALALGDDEPTTRSARPVYERGAALLAAQSTHRSSP